MFIVIFSLRYIYDPYNTNRTNNEMLSILQDFIIYTKVSGMIFYTLCNYKFKINFAIINF